MMMRKRMMVMVMIIGVIVISYVMMMMMTTTMKRMRRQWKRYPGHRFMSTHLKLASGFTGKLTGVKSKVTGVNMIWKDGVIRD